MIVREVNNQTKEPHDYKEEKVLKNKFISKTEIKNINTIFA